MSTDASPSAWPPELARAEHLRLTTYAADGTPSSTPVRFAGREGALLVAAVEGSEEVEHLRADPRADVVACDAHGTPQGAEVRARASLLEGEEALALRALVERRHGVRESAHGALQRVAAHGAPWVGVELHRDDAAEPPGAGAARGPAAGA